MNVSVEVPLPLLYFAVAPPPAFSANFGVPAIVTASLKVTVMGTVPPTM